MQFAKYKKNRHMISVDCKEELYDVCPASVSRHYDGAVALHICLTWM